MGRFTQMDTWMGRNHDPITLHKYLYANVDPVNGIAPSGNMTLMETMNSINNTLVLANMAISTYNDMIGANDDGSVEGIPTVWDYLMSYVVQAATTSIDSPGLEQVTFGVGLVASTGDMHHTIPVYCCGHRSQSMSLISKADHKALHSQLYAFTTAVNVAGRTFDLMFNKRKRGAKRAPLQRVASKKIGRQAIVQGLTRFYVRNGYSGKGFPSIGNVLSIEGPRFINGHHSVKRKCKR